MTKQANLVAITWIGRGTYGPEDWEEALATARAEAHHPQTWRYLLGIPQLADYLEDGLDALGIDVRRGRERPDRQHQGLSITPCFPRLSAGILCQTHPEKPVNFATCL